MEFHVHIKGETQEFETNDLVDDALLELAEALKEENETMTIRKVTVIIE